MHARSCLRSIIAAAAVAFMGSAYGAVIATFDDLPTPPALNDSTGLFFANADSSVYKGITWGEFSVVGDQYKVQPEPLPPPNPLFGIPHSPNYFVTNEDGASGLLITTDMVLTGAWFGRNQYYGFSEGGADQVTIVALAGATELGSVVFDLPDTHPGEPEPLSFVDTSVFGTLSGITGYRIDRRELGQQAGHWVADDFQFVAPFAVSEPAPLALLGLGLGVLAVTRRRRAYSAAP
jgi:hypothetical protein